jgi:hypothetical protein
MNTEVCTVTVSFQGNILLTQNVKNSFTIGESPLNDFIVSGFESKPIVTKETKGFLVHPGFEECGGVQFQVSLSRPNPTHISRDPLDKAFWGHLIGTSVLALSFFTLTSLMPEEALSMGSLEVEKEAKYARYFAQPDLKEEVEQESLLEALESKSSGKRASGNEGSMGNPKAKAGKSGRVSIKGPVSSTPQLSRTFDPDKAARNAGILGIMASQEGHFLASLDGGSFTVGQDDSDIWGNMTGTDFGEDYGTGGLGLIGSGRMGGGPAEGVIGIGNTGLIGKPHLKPGISTVGFGPKEKKPPVITTGKIDSTGIDRDMVRRVVRAHLNEIRSCYNAGLTKNPTLEGRVLIQFTIITSGKVASSIVQENTTKDVSVGDCINRAVKRWKFPSLKGTAVVSYPFRLDVG